MRGIRSWSLAYVGCSSPLFSLEANEFFLVLVSLGIGFIMNVYAFYLYILIILITSTVYNDIYQGKTKTPVGVQSSRSHGIVGL